MKICIIKTDVLDIYWEQENMYWQKATAATKQIRLAALF